MQPRPSFNTSPRRQRPIQCARYALAVTTAADGARLLLLAQHTDSGVVSVRRAQCWPPGATAGTVATAVGAAYRTATGQAPTSVHLVHTGPGSPWPTLIRRAVGPLAELTTHATTSDAGWPAAVRRALTGLNTGLTEDPEQVTALAEHATNRTT